MIIEITIHLEFEQTPLTGKKKMNSKLTQCTLGCEGEKEENKFHKLRVM